MGKPFCPYGLKCTRDNLFHRDDYQHPMPVILTKKTEDTLRILRGL